MSRLPLIVLAAALAVAGLAGRPAWGQAGQDPPPDDLMRIVERGEDDLLVVGLRANRINLLESMIAFTDRRDRRGVVFLSLSDVIQILDLAIEVDPEAGRARGWFVREDRKFELDLRARTAVVAGRIMPLTAADVERHPDDIYVSTAALAEWFSIKAWFDIRKLLVEIKSPERLPFEERRLREQRKRYLDAARRRPDYPMAKIATPLAVWPVADLRLNGDYASDLPEDRAIGGATLLAAGVVGGYELSALAAANTRDSLTDLRATVTRTDLEGRLLGPIGATRYSIGDVSSTTLPLIADSVAGRGVFLTTYPVPRHRRHTRITLRGTLPDGWEAELYRNNVLLDSQSSGTDARYEFEEVPTVVGLNVFQIVLYGPEGQRRVEEDRFFVDGRLVPAGETYLELSANQQESDLVELDDDDVKDEDDDQGRYILRLEHGLTDRVALRGGASSLSVDNQRRRYGFAGLATSLFGTVGELRGAISPDNGYAWGADLVSRLGTADLFVTHEMFTDFVSEETDGDLTSRTEGRVTGFFGDAAFGHYSYGLDAEHRRFDDRGAENLFSTRLSTAFGRLRVTNENSLLYRPGEPLEADGVLRIGTLLGRFRLRGNAFYQIEPTTAFDRAELTATWEPDRVTQLDLRITHQRDGEDRTSAAFSASRDFRVARGALRIGGDDRGEFQAGFSVSIGFGYFSGKGAVARSRGMTDRGAVTARVFLDRDTDGEWDDGEAAIPGVGFLARGFRVEERTDESGTLLLTQVPSHRVIELGIDERSIENPFWVPATKGVGISTKPGGWGVLDLPVIISGVVEGTVTLRRGTTERRLATLQLELVGPDGAVVAETRSEYDGFYLFDRVRPGKYRLRVVPKSAKRHGITAPAEFEIEIDPADPVVIRDILLIRRRGLGSQPSGQTTVPLE